MQRYAQIIKLRPERREDYIRCHAAVWPDVLATIGACNMRNYSIFLRDDVLFAYFEYHGTDYPEDMRKMAADPATQRWWRMVDPMQETFPDATPDSRWTPLTEVFHFDGESS